MSASNPFRGRPVTWSSVYGWVLLWMASLTIPTFQMWRSASSPDRWEYPPPGPEDVAVPVALALATVLLGFAIGWKCRWSTLWMATALGAVVLQVGDEVALNNGWVVGGDPGFNLFLYFAVLFFLAGVGALVGAFAGGARIRRSDHGNWRLQ